MIAIRNERELGLIRDSCRIVGLAHRAIKGLLRPGVRTDALDRVAEEVIRDSGARPAFKGYHGYPSTICISINDQVIHGIPGARKVEAGDLVSVDIGANYKGFFGDQAVTYGVGEVSEQGRELMEVTRQSLLKGIEAAQAGRRLADVSEAIQQYVESHGFSVVRQFVGHGIGTKLHEDPPVPNYVPLDRNPKLRKGITLAVEPMVNVGRAEVVVADDGWTASTADGTCSAHFEHVIAVDGESPQLLTMTEEEIFGTS